MLSKEMPEYERSGDCIELESKLYNALFAPNKPPKDAIFYIRGLWAKVTRADKDYLLGLLDVLADADASRLERYEDLTIALLGLKAFANIMEPPMIAFNFAAGDGEDDTVEFEADLSNGWKCHIACWNADRDTELTLTVDKSQIKAPTIKVRPLCLVGEGRGRYLDIDFNRDTELVPGKQIDSEQFLYCLKGDLNVLVSIPGVPETLKILTLEQAKYH